MVNAYIIIALLAAALLLALWRLHKAGQRLRAARQECGTYHHDAQRAWVEVAALRQRLVEADEVLKAHTAMQCDARWQPQLAEVLRKYYGH